MGVCNLITALQSLLTSGGEVSKLQQSLISDTMGTCVIHQWDRTGRTLEGKCHAGGGGGGGGSGVIL